MASSPAAVSPMPTQVKEKKARATRVVKPAKAYVVFQITDADGNPLEFPRSAVKVLGFYKSAEKFVESIENGTHKNALYISGTLPASR